MKTPSLPGVLDGFVSTVNALGETGIVCGLPGHVVVDRSLEGISANRSFHAGRSACHQRCALDRLWIAGHKYSLLDLVADPAQRAKWPVLLPLAINNAGQIVGQGGMGPEDGRAFLMTPLLPGPLAHSARVAPGPRPDGRNRASPPIP